MCSGNERCGSATCIYYDRMNRPHDPEDPIRLPFYANPPEQVPETPLPDESAHVEAARGRVFPLPEYDPRETKVAIFTPKCACTELVAISDKTGAPSRDLLHQWDCRDPETAKFARIYRPEVGTTISLRPQERMRWCEGCRDGGPASHWHVEIVR